MRTELLEACLSMSHLGLSKGTSGNISVPCGDGFLISPTGVAYDKIKPEHVVMMNWDATYADDVLPSSEWRFHRDILRARPELADRIFNVRLTRYSAARRNLQTPW